MPKWVLVVAKWTKEAVKKKLAGKKFTTRKPKPKTVPKSKKPKATPKTPWVIKAKPKMQMIKERIDRENGIKPKDSGKALTKAPTKKKPKAKRLVKVDKKKKAV